MQGSASENPSNVTDKATYPRRLREFVGQDQVKARLADLLAVALKNREALDHLLFAGATGIGKTSLARIVANEMGVNLKLVSSPNIRKTGELAAILTNLRSADVLLLQQMESVSKEIVEVLLHAMREFALDLVIGKKASAREIRLKLPRFTVIGSTTRLTQVDESLRNTMFLFGLDSYDETELSTILLQSASLQGIKMDLEAANVIAKHSNGLPAQALTLLKRVHKSAQAHDSERITPNIAEYALAGLDSNTVAHDREPIPDDVKMFVWQRDRGQCVVCGSKDKLEFDHIIPIVEGGSNTSRNLQLLCEKHNRSKGMKIG